MKSNSKRLLVIAVLLASSCDPAGRTGYTEYVDPFIGTGGHGHTYPGAILPFGMVQLGPDTRLTGWDGCSAYHYSDDIVYGFSHTHLSGTGCSDYGDVLFMPVSGEVQLTDRRKDVKVQEELVHLVSVNFRRAVRSRKVH